MRLKSSLTTFGYIARHVMLEKRITSTQVAKHIGISNSFFSEILRGKYSDVKYRPLIEKYLDI